MGTRLKSESSLYLREHQNDPVDWYAWGPEALERARLEMKPIFLSIGYSACHWCHVMQKESFSDLQVAEFLNQNFIPVKVDREERPDLDHLYMQAVQMMTGQGGWPLSVFLTPDLRPFFGGTYFPLEPRYGRPSFKQVLVWILDVFRNKKDEVQKNTSQLVGLLAQESRQWNSTSRPLDKGLLDRIEENLRGQRDLQNGGLGQAPKFFHVDGIRFLLRRFHQKNEPDLGAFVETTLDRISGGGVHDVVEGGFHRYSTDAEWRIPHFEKMLYDNALLLRAYTEGFLFFGHVRYQRVVEKTIDYLLSSLRSPQGLFYSSMDADTEGEEGAYYTWTLNQLKSALTHADYEKFIACFGLSMMESGSTQGVIQAKDWDFLENTELTTKLRQLRRTRAQPLIDTKTLSSWNGLMIGALASASQVFQRSDWLEAAVQSAQEVWTQMWSAGRLKHQPGQELSFLEDAAYTAEGFLKVFEVTADDVWLDRSAQIMDFVVRDFYDSEEGGFWTTLEGRSDVLIRVKDFFDGALPSPSAVALQNLNYLYLWTGESRWLKPLDFSLERMSDLVQKAPGGFQRLALLIADVIEGVETRIFVDEDAAYLKECRTYRPGRALFRLRSNQKINQPLFENKTRGIYRCKGDVCTVESSSAA